MALNAFTRAGLLTGALSVAGIAALSPAAHADGLGGISGWSPATPVCGSSSISPVLVTNATNETQTGSVTIPAGLSAQVVVFATQQDALESAFGGECAGRPEIMSAPEFSSNFTVAPLTTEVFWLAMGGMDYNLVGDSHSFAIGGLPSGTPGQSWYDFYLDLNADESFVDLNLAYEATGGTNLDNGQNGFNAVQCSTANGNLNPTDSILTPYSSKTDNSVNYGANQPICMGWAPVGVMETFTVVQGLGPSGNIGAPPSLTVLGAQYNSAAGGSVSIAGTLPEGVTVVSAQAMNGGYYTDPATTTPSQANGWVTTSGTEWAVVDVPVANMAGGQGCVVQIIASDGSWVNVSINNVPGAPPM